MRVGDTPAEQAFIAEVARGAIAAQRRYGVPAAVTIAQAIDESGWGQSQLAVSGHNLFGIKGSGPAGSISLPTQEYENGQFVTLTAPFRAYHDIGESIEDHGKLLATNPDYRQAMAERHDPNAFAAALTGIYATDPQYGAKLIGLMKHYHLYRFDELATRAAPRRAVPARGAGTGVARSEPSNPAPAAPSKTHEPHAARSNPSPSPAPDLGAPHSSASHPATSRPARTTAPDPWPGGAPIPGLPAEPSHPAGSRASAPGARPAARPPGRAHGHLDATDAVPSAATMAFEAAPAPASHEARPAPSSPARSKPRRYKQPIPTSVWTALITTARMPLLREEPLYREIAKCSGVRWELLAACDWMQCRARKGYSSVRGEKLGTVNPDGTIYRTRSEALEQCAHDLVQLPASIYQIDAAVPGELSVAELASVFAAFRWGRLLQAHHTSAMEFPYSVAGLTVHHINMRWPNIAEPNTPDKPGGRFRPPFGAVPIVLSLNYHATVELAASTIER